MSLVENLTRGAIKHVKPVKRNSVGGLVLQVYAQAEREFALAPPLTVHSVDPQLLAAVWAAIRETLIVGPNRPIKEAIAAAVSVLNTCPFCVDIHSVMIQKSETIDAILDREPGRIRDTHTANAVRLALATTSPDQTHSLATKIAPSDLPAFAGTAVLFHYINRIVNVFMRDSSPLAAAGLFRKPARALASITIGRSVTTVVATPGGSPASSETSEVTDIPWLNLDKNIGASFASLFKITSNSLQGLLSDDSIEILNNCMTNWRGEQPPVGSGWVTEATRGIPQDELPVARLALLSGRAAYMVTEADIEAVRSIHHSDASLVRVVAWGAGTASRRVAEWIGGER